MKSTVGGDALDLAGDAHGHALLEAPQQRLIALGPGLVLVVLHRGLGVCLKTIQILHMATRPPLAADRCLQRMVLGGGECMVCRRHSSVTSSSSSCSGAASASAGELPFGYTPPARQRTPGCVDWVQVI